MKSIKQTLKITALFLLAAKFANAQDAAPATTFSGNADAYYKFDFANRINNSYTSFTNTHDSFELGMASIKATHKYKKASVIADLGFGNRAQQFSYNDVTGSNSATFLIKQLNVTYEFNPAFKVTMGSFATHLGYEVIDAVDNRNYSMSYAFTYGPFFNTGVKAQYTSGKFGIMAGITNPTDFKSTAQAGTKQKTYIGQLSYTGDKSSAFLNFTSGSFNPTPGLTPNPTVTFYTLNKTQVDFVGSTKLMDNKLTLAVNGTVGMVKDDFVNTADGNWFSVVGYANYAFKPKMSLALRTEYFDDKKGVVAFGTVSGAQVVSNTLTLNIKEGNLTIMPEFRFDTSTSDLFLNEGGKSTGTNGLFILATTYNF